MRGVAASAAVVQGQGVPASAVVGMRRPSPPVPARDAMDAMPHTRVPPCTGAWPTSAWWRRVRLLKGLAAVATRVARVWEGLLRVW